MDTKHLKNATLASLTAMFLTLALLTMALPSAFAHSGDTLIAPHGAPPTIDAAWSDGEWDDAPQYTMVGNQTSYIRAKYDGNYLYVLIDIPWDTTNAVYFYNENFWLAFDTAHDGGTTPQTDDYLVSGMTDNTDSGIGMGWQGDDAWDSTYLGGIGIFHLAQGGSNTTPGAPQSPMLPSPNSGTPHRICEMQVPLALIGSPGSTVGFYANVDDESSKPGWPSGDENANSTAFSEWPSNAGGNTAWPGTGTEPSNPCPTPDNWGNLILQPQPGTYSYKVVGGTLTSTTQMGHPDGVSPPQYPPSYWDIPYSPPRNASPYLTPGVGGFDITFGSPDGNGVVPLNVPAASYQGFWHVFWNTETDTYFNLSIQCENDGYGWLFTQANADVDIIIWNDDTGMYWMPGYGNQPNQPILPPSIGVDGLAGTSDDGFGDGDLDPAGSSILWLNLTLYVNAWNSGTVMWEPLFSSTWPALMTTETSSDTVNEPNSHINGATTGILQGKTWEYINSGEPWLNDKSNVYAEYVTTGSVLNIPVSFIGVDLHLDVLFKWSQLILRTDCEVTTPAYPPGTHVGWQWLVGDGDLDNSLLKVDYNDLFALADAYGAEDEEFGNPVADANFDARFDFNYNNRVDFEDLFTLADNYGNYIALP